MFIDAALEPSLPASDMDRAKKWYSEKLGLEPDTDDMFGATYSSGGAGFLLYPSEFAGTNQATAAGFSVENFDEVIAELRSRGVEFEHVDFGEMGSTVDGVLSDPEGNMKVAWFKDSEGNILALNSGM